MAGMSTYLEDKLLNALLGTAFGASPAGLFVALFNGDPTDSGTGGTEVTTQVRAAGRVQGTFAKSGQQIANSAVVDFGNAANATTITHFAIYDAASAGNLLVSNSLSSGSGSVSAGTKVSFATGALVTAAS